MVVLAASLFAFATGVWLPRQIYATGISGIVWEDWLLTALVLGGVLGVAAVFVATRAPVVGKIMVALGGLFVLSGFFTLERITMAAIYSMGIVGGVMLLAAPFMGRMPTPEEEGLPRTM